MSTTGMESSGHPITRFTGRIHEVLDGLADTPAWSMTPTEQRTALIELSRAESRILELRLRVLAAADHADIAADSGASSTAAWLAHATRRPRSAARAEVRLAHHLDGPHTATRDALAAGLLDPAQARVIIHAVHGLPDTVEAGVAEVAEKHLIGLAQTHDEKTLKMLGRRVFEVIDPDAADLEEGRRLAAEETAAARRTYLHLLDNRDGTHTGRFKIASLHAAALTKILNALMAPRRSDSTDTDPRQHRHQPAQHRQHRPQRRSTAPATDRRTGRDRPADRPADRPLTGRLTGRVRRLLGPTGWVRRSATSSSGSPTAGSPPPAASPRPSWCSSTTTSCSPDSAPPTSTPDKPSPPPPPAASPARPASSPPSTSESSAAAPSSWTWAAAPGFHTEHQRIALDIEQGGCTSETCDRPAGWCHAHHDIPWSQGGDTSLTNGRLLCPFHHRKAHDPHYDMHHLPHRQVSFHRRP